MKFAFIGSQHRIVFTHDPGHPGRRNQSLRHRRGARRLSRRSPRNSSAPRGHKLVTHFDLPPALVRKIDAGEPYDVIILSYDVDALIKQGKVVADSRTVFGRVGVGVAVRQGAPKPDFSTVEAFKRSLLNAKTIATSGEGSSGRYVASLIERLGIAEQIKPKIRSGAARRLRADGVARRGRLRGVGAAAADRHPQHRVARLPARGDQQLAGVQRRGWRQRQGSGGRARAC